MTGSGNQFTGTHTETAHSSWTSTASDSGSDARGTFTATASDTQTTNASDNGNDYNGTDSASQTATTLASSSKQGDDSYNTYSQGVSDSNSTTTQDNSDLFTGSDTLTTTGSDGTTTNETGQYLSNGTSYNLSQSDSTNTTDQAIANIFSGADSVSGSATTTTTVQQMAASGANTDTITESQTDSPTWQTSGDDYTGSYSSTSGDSNSKWIEDSTRSSNDVVFNCYMEMDQSTSTVQESGNWLSGAYTRTTSSASSTALEDSYEGTLTTSVTDSLSESRQETGNALTGGYNASLSDSDGYTMSQVSSTGDNASLRETGTETSSGTESGDSLKGTYSRVLSGSDSYNMVETGYSYGMGCDSSTPQGSWTQTVQGSETNTLTESGDKPDQTFQRSASGSGGYSMTETGPRATTPGGSGNYGYGLTENGDWKAASLVLRESGSDRYQVLRDFTNVSNTKPGSGPGDLDYSPFGAPFSDAPPEGHAIGGALGSPQGSPDLSFLRDDVHKVLTGLELDGILAEYSPEQLVDYVAEEVGVDRCYVGEQVADYLEYSSKIEVPEEDIADIRAQCMRDFPTATGDGKTVGEAGPEAAQMVKDILKDTGVSVAMAMAPGPELAILKILESKYGVRLFKEGGKWVWKKVIGNEVKAFEEFEKRAIVREYVAARKAAPKGAKTVEDFLPEAQRRLEDTKAKYPGMEGVKGMAKKLDIKQIDRIVKEEGLTIGQREILHEEITKQGFTLERIREIAREIKELYPNK